jgi:hypothetical protein
VKLEGFGGGRGGEIEMQRMDWRAPAGRVLLAAALSVALGMAGAGTAIAEGDEPAEAEQSRATVAGEGAGPQDVRLLPPWQSSATPVQQGDVTILVAPGVEVTRVPSIRTQGLRQGLEPSGVREKGVGEALDPEQAIPSHGVSSAFYTKRYRTIPLNRAPDPDRIPRTDLRRSLEPSRIRSHRLGSP